MGENMVVARKKGLTQVGLRYTAFAAVVIALQYTIVFCLQKFLPEFTEDNSVLLSFLLIILTMDMIGFPLVYLLNRNLPAVRLEQHKLGVGRFLLGVLFCAGICGVGMIIGLIFHFAVSRMCGTDPNANNALAELMLGSKPFMRILTVGILAPIFEELIFRKVLVDHLVKYGRWVAIVASGLMFGMFHGNFSQAFFAAGLGIFFAYIYVRTGRIRYTIAYHMAVNLTTSVITLAVTKYYLTAMEEVGQDAVMSGDPEAAMAILPATLLYLGWIAILGLCALVGLVLLCINLKKFRMQPEEGETTFGGAWKAVLGNPGILAFVAVCIFLFVKTYLFG